ncbi:conserved exported hypothetical protein [Rubrivivax sp. A210]|uniref:hypothetical protein n=1 Tax=Rubrivivax sp. A210 TaxID=2772301 RepID=UPI00191A6AD2|nr:hypothetical protein [Rubrivivax sp. A210]CAD5372846.1 conserved exported hypothetical protein [Rubrivivax sp. A210]
MKPRRPLLWGGLLAGAAALLVLAPPEDGDGGVAAQLTATDPAAAGPARKTVRRSAGEWPSARPSRSVRLAEADEPDPRLWFGARVAPPPPRPAPAPPPVIQAPPAAPAAPPLPYRLLGRYAQGPREGVVLQGPDGVLIAHAGDALGEDYRVETLAGNLLVIRHLPLNQTFTMDIGIAR